MKSKTNKPPFTPITLSIEIESQLELDVLAALFNCGPIHTALMDMGVESNVWKTLEDAGADMLSTNRFREKLVSVCQKMRP